MSQKIYKIHYRGQTINIKLVGNNYMYLAQFKTPDKLTYIIEYSLKEAVARFEDLVDNYLDLGEDKKQ